MLKQVAIFFKFISGGLSLTTILRRWSYQHQWLYDSISWTAALAVGGERRFRQLALDNLTINENSVILDLCCGAGQNTGYLARLSGHCTGLDISPVALSRAQKSLPDVTFVEGLAQAMPFGDGQFDLVHTSVALHEMDTGQLQQIIKEVYRVLKPDGVFTLIDFHQPHNLLFWPGLSLFLWLFETPTAWQLIGTDLVKMLKDAGFDDCRQNLYAGGSLQVIQGFKIDD